MLSRSEEAFTKARSGDASAVHRNPDPALHPMEKAKEYGRALQAAKLSKVFAKPFVAALEGHADGVYALARCPELLGVMASGAADGTLRVWDLKRRRCLQVCEGHAGAVRGAAMEKGGAYAISAGDDCTARLWSLPTREAAAASESCPRYAAADAVATFKSDHALRAVDCHWQQRRFATAGTGPVELWDAERSEPLASYSWGADSTYAVRFNPSEVDVFATCGSDRAVALYDMRSNTPTRKLVMATKSNAVAWNPREPFNFTLANEDCSAYTYDMRNLQRALCVHRDHVSAVMDVDYSPTGRELVTAGYDRSIRLFAYNGGHSRNVYHTKRMQRVFAARFSGDGSYVVSGSDDTNVRIWKSQADALTGVRTPKQLTKLAYQKKLKDRYKHLPEVGRILRHTHVPKAIKKAQTLRRTITEADRRKQKRREAHAAEGTYEHKAARKKRIIEEQE